MRGAPTHEWDAFTHIDGLPYKHAMDASQNFLALAIPKSWHCMIPVEAYDKLGHQGVTRSYHILSPQYYWKDVNKNIHKYITDCTLCKREKVKLQM